MTDRDALIHLLTNTLGPNPHLREALAETVLAVISEVQPETENTPPFSYLELLEQLARQRKEARDSGHARLDSALQQLSRRLTQELQRSALELHHSLKAGQPPDVEHVNRLGFDLAAFPVGIAPAYNLRHLSELYFLITRDLQTLTQHASNQLPELARTLRQEQQATAQLLRDVAWESLSTGLFPDQELLRFSDACKHVLQRQRPAAENMLLDIFIERTPETISSAIPSLTDWLYHTGRLHWPLLHTLLPQSLPLILEALVRMPDPIGLEALATIPAKGRDAALLLTLLTLRFGNINPAPIETWASRLKQVVDTDTQRREAHEFWNSHPYVLPMLVISGWPTSASIQKQAPGIPEILTRKMLADLGESTIQDIFNRRRDAMTPHEIRALESVSPVSTAPEADTTQLAPVLHPDEPSPLAHAVEGVIETALDAVKEGNLAEAVLVAALDKGTAGLRQQLTVTIDDDDSTNSAGSNAAESAKIEFSRTSTHTEPPPRTPKEPDIDIWHDRILPFVMQNWAPLSGGSMILTGLLLLEFYIWDKAAWIRYGVSPVIIALVALVLTFMGRRLNRDDEKTETSLAIIQGLAVFLAPLSLLFVTLFFVDSDLSRSNRLLGGIALSTVLLAAWSGVFILTIAGINRVLTRLYSGTLLVINGLLLLLSFAQLMAPSGQWLTPGAKAVFVIGFYVGFGILAWSIRTALKTILNDDDAEQRGLSFYSVTSLGTYALVWGLTHAHLRVLPQPFTYGPLLVLAALLCLRVEFTLLDHRKQRGSITSRDRITSLSYAAYALIGLGLLLSIGQEYVRVCALLLAGSVWAYQAYKLRQLPPPPGLKSTYSIRHENIALTLVTLGLSLIVMIRDFPPGAFPFLAFGIALTLYLLSHLRPAGHLNLRPAGRHIGIFTDNSFVTALSPIYLALAFAVSLVWQWSQRLDPFGFGIAFLLFGAFTLYLGATSKKLIHVHAGMAYCVAALPYLGMMDMELFTLEGNTLVFGLACMGIAWAAMSSLAPIPAFRDSRSTVLWNIGILAFCLLCLRLFLQETLNFSEASGLLQFQMLSAPLLVGGLMLLVGYWSNSYPAIYLALVIFIFIFPEIKDQLLVYPGVRTLVNTGLGTNLTALSLIALVYALKFWQGLRRTKTHDLIWRQKAFPFQAGNSYLLFAHSLMIAALFLISRNLLYRYPIAAFFPPHDAGLLDLVGLLTCLAVFLGGSGYLAFSLWYRTPWFAYLGFLAIIVGSVHAGIFKAAWLFSPGMMPILLLLAFLYSEVLCFTLSKIFPARAAHVAAPFRHVRFFFLWCVGLTGFSLYTLFRLSETHTGSGFWNWLPLMLYFCAIAGWLMWRNDRLWRAWLIAIPGYLLVWQIVLVGFASQRNISKFFDGATTPFHLVTVGTVFGIVLTFFVVEWLASATRFRLLSPLLWISLLFLSFWSMISTFGFYIRTAKFSPFPHVFWQFVILAGISLILGRYLHIAPLWLWALFLLHFLLLPPVTEHGLRSYGAFYLSLSPAMLAGLACILALLALLTRTFPRLYDQQSIWPWSHIRTNTPPIVFAVASQLFVIAAFAQAMGHPTHQSTWITVIALFLATLPAFVVAPYFSMSRRLLFSFPYLGAWIGLAITVQANFSQQLWHLNLPLSLLIACGLFGAIASLLLSEHLRPSQSFSYLTLKYFCVVSMLACVVIAYLPLRNIHILNWQWLLVASTLLFGSALFFKRYAKL